LLAHDRRMRAGRKQGRERRELGFQPHVEAAACAGRGVYDVNGANRFGAGLGQLRVLRWWFAQRGGVSVADQGEVVDPGRWRRVGAGLGFSARVDVAPDVVADRDTHLAALVADLEVGQVEGVEDELDAASDQGGSTS